MKRIAVPVPARRPTFREKYAALERQRNAHEWVAAADDVCGALVHGDGALVHGDGNECGLPKDDLAHADHGVSIEDLVLDEMSRHVVPNRAMRRAAGERSGYTRRRYQVGQMEIDMR